MVGRATEYDELIYLLTLFFFSNFQYAIPAKTRYGWRENFGTLFFENRLAPQNGGIWSDR